MDCPPNDAEALAAHLVQRLSDREGDAFVPKRAILNGFNQVVGTERNLQSGRLRRRVREGRSSAFVCSGSGVPDLVTRQSPLPPEVDGDKQPTLTLGRSDMSASCTTKCGHEIDIPEFMMSDVRS